MLLGDPPSPSASPRLDPEWFVTGCPLPPEAALEAIRKRHGFATRDAALHALRSARDELAASRHPDAEPLAELPG